MEKLNFDSGIREFEINGGGVLRFNPSDPNVYARLVEAGEKIQAVESDMIAKAQALGEEADGTAVLQLMAEADREMKDILAWVFGADNDFDRILGGNVLAVGTNGERIITNFIAALQPVIEAGAAQCAQQQIDTAVNQARADRAARGTKT